MMVWASVVALPACSPRIAHAGNAARTAADVDGPTTYAQTGSEDIVWSSAAAMILTVFAEVSTRARPLAHPASRLNSSSLIGTTLITGTRSASTPALINSCTNASSPASFPSSTSPLNKSARIVGDLPRACKDVNNFHRISANQIQAFALERSPAAAPKACSRSSRVVVALMLSGI